MADTNKHIDYSLADIQQYLQGSMSAKEMHALERAALEDPFLADALEGYSEADMNLAHEHVAIIDAAILAKPQQASVVAIVHKNKFSTWQVAAAVILLAGIAGIIYFIFSTKPNDVALAKIENKSVAVTTDSSQATVKNFTAPVLDSVTAINNKEIDRKSNTSLQKSNKKIINPVHHLAPQPAAPLPDTQGANSLAEAVIITSRNVKLKTSAHEIAGTITDNNQKPVPNAKVMLQDSTKAITDKEGRFQLPINDTTALADVTAFGYKPLKKMQLKNGFNSIILKEKPFLLSDVEVSNIGTAGKKTGDTTAVTPQGGWQSFQQYVYTRLHKKYDSTAISNAYVNGDLQLEFSISEAGEPIDFKVLNAPDDQTASAAIDAIKAGPKWVSKDKNNKMRIRVRYK